MARSGATVSASAIKPVSFGTDQLLLDIADYVIGYEISSAEAVKTARYSVLDTMGCALHGAADPECAKLLGPLVPGTRVPHGARVPGTPFVLDPSRAAFGISTAAAWHEFGDGFLAAEWTKPSSCVGAVLATADYLSSVRLAQGLPPLLMRDVLEGCIKAYEICGVLALENSFNQVGVDGTLLVRVACAAVTCAMLGGGRDEVVNALSQAFADGSSLRTYRHYPNTGPRKAWAEGDAASRAVFHALMAMRGEPGYELVLSAPVWGFYDVFFRRSELAVTRELGAYVAEHVLFRPTFAGEFHAQTAVEAAMQLHALVVHRFDEVHSIVVHTTRSALRLIEKTGPLRNVGDRDCCLQYMVVVALLYGTLTTEHYSDAVAMDPRIDMLRKRTQVLENPQYSAAYLDADRRSVTNAVQVHFADRTSTPKIELEYPLGHVRRRTEAFPQLERKLLASFSKAFPRQRAHQIFDALMDPQRFDAMPVGQFTEMLAVPSAPYLLPGANLAAERFGATLARLESEHGEDGGGGGRRRPGGAGGSPARSPTRSPGRAGSPSRSLAITDGRKGSPTRGAESAPAGGMATLDLPPQ